MIILLLLPPWGKVGMGVKAILSDVLSLHGERTQQDDNKPLHDCFL
jgi:hypothetical protein